MRNVCKGMYSVGRLVESVGGLEGITFVQIALTTNLPSL